MTYQEYAKLCRVDPSRASTDDPAHVCGPVERSERCILRGDAEGARAAIAELQDPRVAYLQAAKASRHFEDPAFLTGRDAPTAKGDWLLPVLRAACSVATEAKDGENIERRVEAASGVRGVEAIRAWMIAANAHRNAGSLEASRQLLLKAFELAPRVAGPGVFQPSTGPDLLFMRRRQSAFRDLLRVVNFDQCSLFPCSGTLLGFHRDQDFIPADGDVDLGCLDPAGFEKVKEAMRASGCFYLSPGRLESNFNARHIGGPKFDVSLYVERGEGWAKTSHVYEWRFHRFSLGEMATDYGRLPVPDPADQYLSAMYEDWWVPRSGYDSRIDSPNLTYVSRDEVVVVLASHFLATYLQGGHEACAGWRRKFERLPGDMGVDMSSFLRHLA